jgi:hypothetical protein
MQVKSLLSALIGVSVLVSGSCHTKEQQHDVRGAAASVQESNTAFGATESSKGEVDSLVAAALSAMRRGRVEFRQPPFSKNVKRLPERRAISTTIRLNIGGTPIEILNRSYDDKGSDPLADQYGLESSPMQSAAKGYLTNINIIHHGGDILYRRHVYEEAMEELFWSSKQYMINLQCLPCDPSAGGGSGKGQNSARRYEVIAVMRRDTEGAVALIELGRTELKPASEPAVERWKMFNPDRGHMWYDKRK